jgi:glycosyltransferase involved in cell wall biosynthesis
MTVSPDAGEPSASNDTQEEGALGASWRARTQETQQRVLPQGSVVASCDAPFGGGGLGRHLKEIVDALERNGQQRSYICASDRESPERGRLRIPTRTTLIAPLARVSPGWRIWKVRVEFDARAARQLPQADHLLAFNRQAQAQFRAARRTGYRSVSLVTGSPHVRCVARQHALAHRQYPLERSFGTFITGRYLSEYELADRIYVASRYTWESFTEQGVPEEKLTLFPLTPDPRYRPDPTPQTASTFNVIYVGGLSVAKGVPLLIDAFRRLPHADMRLHLLGNSKTRGMRSYLDRVSGEDDRIQIGPGDPLPVLRQAGVCVHPTYEDGFAYAPAEALACGVPVLVSEDTGMKDLIDPGRNGLILPTGDLPALSDAIDATYRREILSG